MAKVKFWHCKHCGNIFFTVYDGGATPVCCGEPMEAPEAKTADKATEKHVPVVTRNGKDIEVVVGSTLHPMEKEHWIVCIALVQGENVQLHHLDPSDEPKTVFKNVEGDDFEVYEYCNKHGLWKA